MCGSEFYILKTLGFKIKLTFVELICDWIEVDGCCWLLLVEVVCWGKNTAIWGRNSWITFDASNAVTPLFA